MLPAADQEERQERRAARLKLLTQTSRESLMGQLLRSFWHPIAVSAKLGTAKAMPVRILGEDLTLYRGESGSTHLVGSRCAHRRTLMHTGWVQGENIRCMYHGWQYDGSGQCIHRPAEEDRCQPDVKIGGYATREYCGLVFAYLGDGEAPEFDLPRRDSFEKPGHMLFAWGETWRCNWLQHVENSLDPVHVSFAHQMGRVGEFGQAITTEVPSLTYAETLSGIRQTATRTNQVRVSDWTFPNYNHVPVPGLTKSDPWGWTGRWMVPVDDDHTARFAIAAVPSTAAEADRRITAYFEGCRDYNSADHHDDLFAGRYPVDPLVRLTSAQDYVTLMGQGTVADRANEYLGRSDAGVALLRSILWREIEAIRLGRPTKQWRRPNQAAADTPADAASEAVR